MTAIEVTRYSNEFSDRWDTFVDQALNSTFLFRRGYMDYHSDRFEDCSLLVWQNGKLAALLPANRNDSVLVSHGGLTYGGFVVNRKMNTAKMLAMFESTCRYLKHNGFSKMVYKAIPHIYHQVFCESDLYALFRSNASLIKREISSTVNIRRKLNISNGKKQRILKMKKRGIPVHRSDDFKKFMDIVRANLLAKHDTEPTHTAVEMEMLAGRFPKNIKLFLCKEANDILAGAIIYETKTVAHAQYLAATEIGRPVGALDYVVDFLINEAFVDKDYFDFGISTEQQGWVLNDGLIKQKEEFGARGVVYDTYQIAW